MSLEGQPSTEPLHLVSRLYSNLKRRLSIGRSTPGQTNDQTTQLPSTSTKRPRNRLRSPRGPPRYLASTSHVKAGQQLRLRSFGNVFSHALSMKTRTGGTNFIPSWERPRSPVQPFAIHLPDDVLRTIFEYAAEDLDTACSLALVAFHVRAWVDPILYSRVRLEGLDAIRLFARTIQDSINSEALSGEEVATSSTRRITKPPGFFGCVKSIALLPREDRVLLFFRDAVRNAILILHSCYGVVELEASGDFLRRTDVSEGLLEPPSSAIGDAESISGSTEPISAGPATPIVALHGWSERALMRPTHLTLVPPTLNVNFRLPVLSNVTHLHYASSLPRNLNFMGTLLALTHIAFDYQLGVATVKAEGLLHLVRTALEWGTPPPPAEDAPLADTAADSASSTSDDTDPHAFEIPAPCRLTMVIVRVLLRPRMQDSDRAGEAWRKLAHLAQAEPRLIYFESQGLFGEDVWETAKERFYARERLSTSWYRDSIS
jgi:hypothetical protein